MVDILLATHDGEPYLEAQVDSLLRQDFPEWRVLARDDCSSDGTPALLDRLAREYPDRFRVVPNGGRRLGAAGNFAELMRHSDGAYVMFCDQDDVWLPRKISLTLDRMKALERGASPALPILVHGDFAVVDESLAPLAPSGWRYQKSDPRRCSLNRAMVQNVATGCTVMMNSPLRELCLPLPDGALMHDWWAVLTAAAFGRVGYVSEPLLLYRQHGGNTLGAEAGSTFSILGQLGSLREVRRRLRLTQAQAQAFLARFGSRLTPGDAETVETYARLGERGFFARRYAVARYGFFHTGLLRKAGMLLLC